MALHPSEICSEKRDEIALAVLLKLFDQVHLPDPKASTRTAYVFADAMIEQSKERGAANGCIK